MNRHTNCSVCSILILSLLLSATFAGEGPRKQGPKDTGKPSAEGKQYPNVKSDTQTQRDLWVLRAYDKDKDGQVSFDEWCALKEGKVTEEQRSRERVRFNAADSDRNGQLTFTEFQTLRNQKPSSEGLPKGSADNPGKKSPESVKNKGGIKTYGDKGDKAVSPEKYYSEKGSKENSPEKSYRDKGSKDTSPEKSYKDTDKKGASPEESYKGKGNAYGDKPSYSPEKKYSDKGEQAEDKPAYSAEKSGDKADSVKSETKYNPFR